MFSDYIAEIKSMQWLYRIVEITNWKKITILEIAEVLSYSRSRLPKFYLNSTLTKHTTQRARFLLEYLFVKFHDFTMKRTDNYSKAWFPPGDTFLEIGIETIVTFIPRR